VCTQYCSDLIEKCNIVFLYINIPSGYEYLTGWFLIDVLSIGVPYNLLGGEGSVGEIAAAMGLLKLLRLARIPRLLKRVLHVPLKWKLIVNVLLLLILYIFLCHLLGCTLLVLGKFLSDHPAASLSAGDVPSIVTDQCGTFGNMTCTWMDGTGINDKTISGSTKYMTAFYWSVTTAISVGYGDISGTNNQERLALTFIMLMTMMTTTVLFGSVITIVDKLGEAKKRYDQRTAAIEQFISVYHIEDEAAEAMRNMIEFQWERTKFFDSDYVLSFLPAPLRTDVLLDMNKQFLFTVPFFQDQDHAIITEIVQVLSHELVLPGTMIVHEGQPADQMYFNRFGRFEGMFFFDLFLFCFWLLFGYCTFKMS